MKENNAKKRHKCLLSAETVAQLVRDKDLTRIKMAIRDSLLDIDQQDSEGRTALHLALVLGIAEKDLEFCRQLIDLGAAVNIKDETLQRETPLHAALRLADLQAVALITGTLSFDVGLCGAHHANRALPTCYFVGDIILHPTNTNCSSFCPHNVNENDARGASVMCVRDNVYKRLQDDATSVQGHKPLTDVIVMQDEQPLSLSELLHTTNMRHLTSLHIVDCILEMADDDVLSDLKLRSLVLSKASLRRIPAGVFRIASLEALKVDWNSIDEIPGAIGELTRLRLLSVEHQRPRLRNIPETICKLVQLQALSVASNSIEDISWVTSLKQLRDFRCHANRVRCLPSDMISLQNLVVLDVSDNLLEGIQPSLVALFSRLYRVRYFNATLEPRYVRTDRRMLEIHLELEQRLNLLALSEPRPKVGHITLALVGETGSGKRSFLEALAGTASSPRGSFSPDRRSTPRPHEATSRHLVLAADDDADFKLDVNVTVTSQDVMDDYTRDLHADVYALFVDLTTIEGQGDQRCDTHHLVTRHVQRLSLWLRALRAVAPLTPVIIVGTHAELVRSSHVNNLWPIIEASLLDPERRHHTKSYSDSRCPFCLLCSPPDTVVRQPYCRTRPSLGGFVDLSQNWDQKGGYSDFLQPRQIEQNADFSNGNAETEANGGFPHVIGYYEVDSKKTFPKDERKGNASIEQLRAAIVRLARNVARYEVPPSWIAFIQHMTTIKEKAGNLVAMSFEDVAAIARSFEMSQAETISALAYFHRKGELVYFGSDELLAKVVVINPSWFAEVIAAVLHNFDRSVVKITDLQESLENDELDRQFQKVGLYASQWLQAALAKIKVCVELEDRRNGKFVLLPSLLESGYPSRELWPERPEWNEKQITCDLMLRALKPNSFSSFVLAINRDGARTMQVLEHPVLTYLSQHIVFFSGLDTSGCDDCRRVKSLIRSDKDGMDATPVEESPCDDVIHKVHIRLEMDAKPFLRVQVRGINPCCVMKNVLDFIQMYFDDVPNDGDISIPHSSSSTSLLSSSDQRRECPRSISANSFLDKLDIGDHEIFLLCPKCILLRHTQPERFAYPLRQSPRVHPHAICARWHNLGSWARVATGDYRGCGGTGGSELPSAVVLKALPEHEHPRLALVLPPSEAVSEADWVLRSRMRFLEGFEVHFLCEYTGYWHMTDGAAGFRLSQARGSFRAGGSVGRTDGQLALLLKMAVPVIQCIQGATDQPQNARMVAPVVAELVEKYEYLRNVDPTLGADPRAWLGKYKERLVTMLCKVLFNASDGVSNAFAKSATSVSALDVFQSVSPGSRSALSAYFRLRGAAEQFAALRPVFVGREIRWVCAEHYEELRTMTSKS